MAEQSGKNTVIKISGVATSMINEAVTDIDHQIYQITNTAKQVLDPLTPPTVKVGGSVTGESYTVNYLSGKIIFATVNAVRGTVTVGGNYLPMTTVAYANKLSSKQGADILDVSRFGIDYKARMVGLKYASGTLSQWDVLDTYFETALTAGVPVVIETRPIAGVLPDRYWALLESTEMAAALENPQNQTVSWVSNNSWLALGI